VSLREVEGDAGNRRVWVILVGDLDAGRITAELDGDRALLNYPADELADEVVLRQAIGRLVGAPPFEGATVLAVRADAADTARRRVLDGSGFERVDVASDGVETWERPAGIRPRTGPERFLDRDGRIERYPVRAADLHELLVAILPRVLSPGEVLGEAEINDRIRPIAKDIAFVRRALVDDGLVERTLSGTEYALIEDVDKS
jgi:hypothetical protein